LKKERNNFDFNKIFDFSKRKRFFINKKKIFDTSFYFGQTILFLEIFFDFGQTILFLEFFFVLILDKQFYFWNFFLF